MLIEINYMELEWDSYGEKIAILDILKNRVENKRKAMQMVLGMVGPTLNFIKREDMHC